MTPVLPSECVNLSLHLLLDKAIMKRVVIKQNESVQRRETEFFDGVPQGMRSQDVYMRKIRTQLQQSTERGTRRRKEAL